jgi:hypothetical protein
MAVDAKLMLRAVSVTVHAGLKDPSSQINTASEANAHAEECQHFNQVGAEQADPAAPKVADRAAGYSCASVAYSRNSMNRSPCSSRFTVSGQSGSSHASNTRFEQLPFRIQINATGVGSSSQRSTKSSSLLTIIAFRCRAWSQTSGSCALANAAWNTCVA